MVRLSSHRAIVSLLLLGGGVAFAIILLAITSSGGAHSQPNQLDRAVIRENAIAKCMRGGGWQYTPTLYPGESEEIARSGVSKASQQKRIKVPTAIESAGGPANAAAIKQSDRAAYIQAYWGTNGSQGCKAVGDQTVQTSDPRIRTIDENGAKVAKLVTDRLAADPRLTLESKRYVQCMARLGYTTVSGWVGPHQLRERIYAQAGTGGPGGGYDPKTPEGKALEAKLAALASADGRCNTAWNKTVDEVTREALIEGRKSVGID
jgi:hypothetical protein